MCDLSYGVYMEGRQEGRLEGLLESVRSIMSNLKISAEEALKVLNIPQAEWNEYLKRMDTAV